MDNCEIQTLFDEIYTYLNQIHAEIDYKHYSYLFDLIDLCAYEVRDKGRRVE